MPQLSMSLPGINQPHISCSIKPTLKLLTSFVNDPTSKQENLPILVLEMKENIVNNFVYSFVATFKQGYLEQGHLTNTLFCSYFCFYCICCLFVHCLAHSVLPDDKPLFHFICCYEIISEDDKTKGLERQIQVNNLAYFVTLSTFMRFLGNKLLAESHSCFQHLWLGWGRALTQHRLVRKLEASHCSQSSFTFCVVLGEEFCFSFTALEKG